MPALSPRRETRSLLRESAGFTLVELLVAMSLFVGVMAAAGALLFTMQKSSYSDTEDANAQVETQTGLDRMVRELRQATDVTLQGDNQITVTLLDGSQLSYKCDTAGPSPYASYNACYRLTAAAGASLPTPTAGMARILRVSNPASKPVFTYTLPVIDDSNTSDDEASDSGNTPAPPSPVYVAVHIETPARGELIKGRTRTIVLDSGFALRNAAVQNNGGSGS